MCIIAVSAGGVKPLDKNTLQRCFAKNPDGAGFAYWDIDNEIWHVEKGLMTFEAFWNAFSVHNFGEDDYVVCHFRVGTSGLKDGGNTHPFPVTDDVEEMRQLKFMTKSFVIHNGVIGKGEAIPSDTMCFVRDYFKPMLRFIKEEPRLLEILEEESDTKRCRWFFTIGADVYQWGTWVTSPEGWEFSNDGYKPVEISVWTNPNYHGTKYNTFVHPQTVSPLLGRRTFVDYYDTGGNFQSNLWKQDIARNLGMRLNSDTDTKLIEAKVPTEIDDDFVYGVLSDDGTITVWDKMPDIGVGGEKYLFCPECFEDNRIMENPYEGNGDTLCQVCGAIFVDATGDIVGHDPDYRKIYLEMKARKEAKIANG